MSAIQPIAFLDAIAGYVRSDTNTSADRPIKLAVIDPAYDAFSGLYPGGVNPARVTFDGESTLSAKAYPVASGYIPHSGNRVYLVPIGNTYLIVGTVSNLAAQGFYSSATDTGVEFGLGSYFDTNEGLSLQTDADIAGDLYVGGSANIGGWDAGKGLMYSEERTTASGTGTSTETLVWSTASIVFPASRAIRVDVGFAITNNTAASWSFPRVRKATVTGTILKEYGRMSHTVAAVVAMGPQGSFYFMTGAGGTTTLAMTIQASGSSTASFYGSATKSVGSHLDVFDVGPSAQFTAKGNNWPVLF